MSSLSILFRNDEQRISNEIPEVPAYFVDLNLDQIIDAITSPKEEYNLKPFFYTPLKDIESIKYRQETAKDIEKGTLLEKMNSFAGQMSAVRRILGMVEKLYYTYHKEGWYLEAVIIYCNAITSLAEDLSKAEIKSKGLLAFRKYVKDYAQSDQFLSLQNAANKIKADLSLVKYCIIIKGRGVKVRGYESETNYSDEIEETFKRFKQGAAKDYRVNLTIGSGMNHVEAKILEFVAKIFPNEFNNLLNFFSSNADFIDETICNFDREIQFFISYLDYIKKIKNAGLKFCYPKISHLSKDIYDYDCFDLALANARVSENAPIIANDFYLTENERIFIVSGPNQGGKTTFARAFGQLHYLASLGCSVPGRKAQLFLFDNIFTHFETEEDIKTLRGKLQDDMVRIYDILQRATPDSIVIINEIFTSTALKDAIELSKKIMQKIIDLDLLCVCVTFLDELVSMSEKNVSMVSSVVPENPALRTFKIQRKMPDGLAYAISIAEKYNLTYADLKERIKS